MYPNESNWRFTLGQTVVALVTLVLCGYSYALSIESVVTEHGHITDKDKKPARISFVLDAPAVVTLSLYDRNDRLVHRIDGGSMVAGSQSFEWNGHDSSGKLLPSEAYTYTLSAVDRQGDAAIYDVSDSTGGKTYVINNIKWNKSAGTINYRLSQAGRVRVRIGLDGGGPLLATPVEWQVRAAGQVADKWSGFDQANALQIGSHPKLKLIAEAYTLSNNTIIVENSKNTDYSNYANSNTEVRASRKPANSHQGIGNYGQQDHSSLRDVTIEVDLGNVNKNNRNVAIVSGTTPITINASAADKALLMNRRFEAVFYVDGQFAFENEMASIPMTWNWDSKTVPRGEHFISVNLRGYEGNFGITTFKVVVE